MTLLSSWVALGLLSMTPPPTAVAPVPPGVVVPDLREESTFRRIKERNLYHPTRGVLPTGTSAAPVAHALPDLVGTIVSERHAQASFRWPGQEGVVILEVREKHEDLTLLEVKSDRVQIQIGSGERQWLELAKLEEPQKGASDDLSRLLLLGKEGGRTPSAEPRKAGSQR